MWIDQLIGDYHTFLREKTLARELQPDGWVEISTPYLDVFNDTIDIYAKRKDQNILLSDDGATLRNLELIGLDILRSETRRTFLMQILRNYGITLHRESQEFIVETSEKDFPQKKLNLVSAIAEANDLHIINRQSVANIFRDDVRDFLIEKEVIFTPHFISRGDTGLEFTFDFQIAASKKETLIKAFNSVNKTNLPQFLFIWQDVKPVRERQTAKEVLSLAFINDTDKEIKKEYLEAFHSKGAATILWSERESEQSLSQLKSAA